MFPLAAASLNVMFNPGFEYPNALPVLNPVRFSNTAKPPFGPTRYAYRSPLNPPVMSSVTVTLLMEPPSPPTVNELAKPLALLSGITALSVRFVLHDCCAQADAANRQAVIVINVCFMGFVFLMSMHIPRPVIALWFRADVGEDQESIECRRIGDLRHPVDRRCQVGRQIQRVIVAGNSQERRHVRAATQTDQRQLIGRLATRPWPWPVSRAQPSS